MRQDEIEHLQELVRTLESENARLRTAIVAQRGEGEKALAASEQRYRRLFDSIDEGFCIIEFFDGPHGPLSDYVHVEANPAYTRHAGIANVVGQKVREMVPHEADGWVKLYRGVLMTGEPIRFERELEATGRYLDLAAFRVEPESQRQVAVLFQDITARKKAEAALQLMNETLEARVAETLAERNVLADIVEGTNAPVQVVDTHLRWMAINRAAADEFDHLFGVRPAVGDNLPETMRSRPDVRDVLVRGWRRAIEGEEYAEVAAFDDARGARRHYERHFNTLRTQDGTAAGAFQFAYDVTDRIVQQERLRLAEEALRQSQKMEAVGQLTGGIAHDFNNMLAVVISSLRLTQRRLDRGDQNVQEFIASGLKGAESAANLVSRLLAFSRQQALSPQPTDANKLLRDMEDVLRRAIPESISIELVQSGGLWQLNADPHGIESAIVNLAVNARDAMLRGGALTIETANAYLDDAYAAAYAEVSSGQYVMIAVTDSGHGMASDVVARAFEPFFTTKAVGSGTGLGLSQVYGFVKQSGGHVKIYSEVGVGTSVKLYFPRIRASSAANSTVASEAAQTPRGDGQLVLVVEDDDDVRQLTSKALVELGYRALPAREAMQALRLLAQHDDVALLMTDVVMPGMNGRELAEEALRRKPGLRLLFATGYARNALIHNGALDETYELVMKPYTIESLAAKVAKSLAGKNPG